MNRRSFLKTFLALPLAAPCISPVGVAFLAQKPEEKPGLTTCQDRLTATSSSNSYTVMYEYTCGEDSGILKVVSQDGKVSEQIVAIDQMEAGRIVFMEST